MRLSRFRLPIDGFLLALIGAVALAAAFPVRGWFAGAVDASADVFVALLFFLYGARLSPTKVRAGLGKVQLQAAVLTATFVAYPLLAVSLALAAGPWLSPALATGVMFLGCLPSTVQSSVGFTGVAKGHVAAALCAAATSNILGVVLTPLLAAAVLGGGSVRLDGSGAVSVLLQLVGPFLLGQLSRRWLAGWAERRNRTLTMFDRAVIVLIVYAAFSSPAAGQLRRTLALADVGLAAGLCVLLFAMALAGLWAAALALRLPHEDRPVLLFCGSHKSLVAGAPLAAALLPAPLVGPALLPVMIFHGMSLFASAVIARRLAAGQERREALVDPA